MRFPTHISFLLVSIGVALAAQDARIHTKWIRVAPTTLATITRARRTQLHPGAEVPPTTTANVSVAVASTEPLPRPPNLPVVNPAVNVKELLLGVLRNARARDKAHECDGVDQEFFYNESVQFLKYRKTEDYNLPRADGVPKTEKDILERLVVYQIVNDTIQDQDRLTAIPETLVDQIRSAYNLASTEGILTGANPRVLNAIDTIYNDVCAKTGRTQVPRSLQDNIDVVVRGLEVNPQLQLPEHLAQRPPCECRTAPNQSPCGVYINYSWDKEQAIWQCGCYTFTDCPIPPSCNSTST